MKWVEKSSIEKICLLLEISERERHYQVLLTRENISAVRHNPAPYTLLVIPRSLPSNFVEGEHFVIADVRRLVSGSTSFSRDPVVEASSRVQGARSASRSSASSSGGSGSSSSAHGRRARRYRPEHFLPLTQVARAAPRVVKVKRKRALERRNAPGSRCENFIDWVPEDTDSPQNLEEQERMERMTGLLDRYATRKRKRQVSSSGESEAALVQSVELSQPAADDQPAADGSSGDRVITILGSPELGPKGGAEPNGAERSESNEGDPAP